MYRQKEVTQQPIVTTIASNVSKMPHVEAQELTDKMTKGQRAGIELWNAMRQKLIDNGLMETN
jgi:hypothetical protein